MTKLTDNRKDIHMKHQSLRERIDLHNRKTGYDCFTPEQSQKAAQEFLSSLHEFRAKNPHNSKDTHNLYLEIRKGYRHGK